MSLQIYKPNSKNAGSAYTFSKTTDKKTGSPVFYISAISQYSWDDNKKTGSFAGNSKDPTKTINVKISEFEAGSFISSFSTLVKSLICGFIVLSKCGVVTLK